MYTMSPQQPQPQLPPGYILATPRIQAKSDSRLQYLVIALVIALATVGFTGYKWHAATSEITDRKAFERVQDRCIDGLKESMESWIIDENYSGSRIQLEAVVEPCRNSQLSHLNPNNP